MDREKFLLKINEKIKQANTIAIVSHISPDEDAIASSLSMQNILKEYYKRESQIFFENLQSNLVNFLEGHNKINWVTNLKEAIKNFDLIIFVDQYQLVKLSENMTEKELIELNSVCIDHHTTEFTNFKIGFGDKNLNACCAVLYYLFLQDKETINVKLGESLLAGILGDTNNFKFLESHNSEVLRIAYEISNKSGVGIRDMADKLATIDSNIINLFKMYLNNNVNVDHKLIPSFSYTFIEKVPKKYSTTERKQAAILFGNNFLRYINGYHWGFIIKRDDSNSFTLSFRSRPGVLNMIDIAKLFGGAGHPTASGAKIIFDKKTTMKSAIKFIIGTIENHYRDLSFKSFNIAV